jgi:predicted aspartyl protease
VTTGLKRFALAILAAAGASVGSAGAAQAECKLVGVAQVAVVVQRNRILLPSEVNGRKVYFIFDTGGRSFLFTSGARTLGLATHNVSTAQLQQRFFGIGGELDPRAAELKQLKIGGVDMSGAEMLVVGDRAGEADDIVGTVGYDVFARYDMEFDLAHQVVRLLKSPGCSDDQMDYWRAPYSVAPLIGYGGAENPHSLVDVQLNGVNTEAVLDTGSPHSTVTLAAAAHAGVRPGSPGVQPIGYTGGLVGSGVKMWAGTFKSFKIGDETIANPTLPMADIFAQTTVLNTGSSVPVGMNTPGMLVGLDFFRAHRVLISREHGKVYFSYNGGPIFEPPRPRPQPGVAPVAAPASTAGAAPTPPGS